MESLVSQIILYRYAVCRFWGSIWIILFFVEVVGQDVRLFNYISVGIGLAGVCFAGAPLNWFYLSTSAHTA